MSSSVTVINGVVRRPSSSSTSHAALFSGPPMGERGPALSRTNIPDAAPKVAPQIAEPESLVSKQEGRNWTRQVRTLLPPGAAAQPAPAPEPAAAMTEPEPAAAVAAPEAAAAVAEPEPAAEADAAPEAKASSEREGPGRRRGRGHAHGHDKK